MGDNHSLSCPHQDELAYPVHHMGPKISSRNQGSKLSNATMISQITVAADVTHSEDPLSLKRGYAVGDCHTLFGAHQEELAYPLHHVVPETSRHQVSELSNATMIPQMTVATDPTHSGSSSV